MAEGKDRSAALRETRDRKLEELFKGKRFQIVKEIHLDEGQTFQTPLGNRGRHGYALRQEGQPDNQFIVGASTLRLAAEQFGAVELPEKKRRSRKETPAEASA